MSSASLVALQVAAMTARMRRRMQQRTRSVGNDVATARALPLRQRRCGSSTRRLPGADASTLGRFGHVHRQRCCRHVVSCPHPAAAAAAVRRCPARSSRERVPRRRHCHRTGMASQTRIPVADLRACCHDAVPHNVGRGHRRRYSPRHRTAGTSATVLRPRQHAWRRHVPVHALAPPIAASPLSSAAAVMSILRAPVLNCKQWETLFVLCPHRAPCRQRQGLTANVLRVLCPHGRRRRGQGRAGVQGQRPPAPRTEGQRGLRRQSALVYV
jgi:hypothetical protein